MEKIETSYTTLYFPALTKPSIFAPGQRKSVVGIWYCQGWLAEDSPVFNRELHSQLYRAKDQIAYISKIYKQLEPNPRGYDTNYALQFAAEFSPTSKRIKITTWGSRLKEREEGVKIYEEPSLSEVLLKYKEDLVLDYPYLS